MERNQKKKMEKDQTTIKHELYGNAKHIILVLRLMQEGGSMEE